MIIRRKIYKNILYSLGAMVLASVFFVGSAHAAPATFTVTSTDDSGAGSLRQAILDANANANPADMDTIAFAIAGSGVQTIEPVTLLPEITQLVTIDGYSQVGSEVNTAISPNPLNGTLLIEINGNGGLATGLNLADGSSGSIVQGLVVHSFSEENILINNNDFGIYGNYLGVLPDGLTPDSVSKIGLKVNSGNGTQVGGQSAQQRNIIGGYDGQTFGLNVGAVGTVVYGNYVGVGKDGVTDLGTFLPMGMTGNESIVGGTGSGQMNVIAGGATANLTIISSNNIVQSNYVGADYTGQKNTALSNGAGVLMTATASENLIGGVSPNQGNTIRNVTGTAITVVSVQVVNAGPLYLNPAKNAILRNSIDEVGVFSLPKFGSSNLGIDLMEQIDTSQVPDFNPEDFAQQGPTPNDSFDADTGANGYINKPILKTAQQVGNQLTITYDLDAESSPSDEYRLEFFASNEGSIFGVGPGEEYLGAVSSSANGASQSITLTVSGDYTNKALSATTTAIDGTTSSGFGSTSEFAQNISIGSATDFDSDGATDAVENAAPNNGDGNDDGTADRLQPTVTSFEIDSTGIMETLVTSGCSENGTVASIDVSSLAKGDAGKSYPYGLVDFSLNCSRGDTVNVTKYVFVDDQPSEFVLRKYNPATELYNNVPNSSISAQTIGDAPALVSTYAITDGGELDDDGAANGIIVDPVGLATTQSLAQTGENLWAWVSTALALVGGAYVLRRKAKA